MADIPNSDELKKINEAAVETVEQFQQLSTAIKGIYKDLNAATGESYRFNDASKQSVNLAKTLSGYTQEDLANQRKRARFERDTNKVKSDLAALEAQIEQSSKRQNTLKGKAAVANQKLVRSLADQRDLIKDALEDAEEMVKVQGELNKRTKFFGDLSDFIGEIPLLNKLLPEFKAAFEAAQKSVAKGGSAWAGGMQEFSKGITKLISVFTVSTLIKGVNKVDQEVTNLEKSLNLTRTQAKGFLDTLNKTSTFTTTQLIKANNDLNNSLGTSVALRTEDVETLSVMTERMGLSADAANKLFNFSAASGKSIKSFTDELAITVKSYNILNKTGIDFKSVMNDVAEVGAATRLSLQRFPGGIVKAAYEARKLGLNLTQLEKTAGSLLDFESSIEAELEAELLSGREYNLERARALALTNDLTGLNEELAAQGITQAKFANANRLEQQAIAGMLGMSRDEMAQMFEKQSALQSINELYLNDNEKLAALLREGYSISEAAATLNMSEVDARKQMMTLEEKRAVLQDRLQNAASAFLDLFDKIKPIFDLLVQNAQALLKVLTAITVLRFGQNLRNLGKDIGNATKSAQQLSGSVTGTGQISKAATAAGQKGAGAVMKSGANAGKTVYGAAAKSAVQAGTAEVISSGASSAGQGFFGKMLGKLNPLQAAGSWVGKNIGKLFKIPIISSLLEGFFAKSDIESIIATSTSKQDMYQAIGKRSLQALGSIGGSVLGGALGSFIPIPGVGTAIGALGGDIAGRWLTGIIADNMDMSGLGKLIGDGLFSSDIQTASQSKPELGLATGGIVTQPTRALVGEAGAEAVVPLREFYAKFDELISSVKQGGNVYMDSMQVGHSSAIGTSRLG